MSLNIGGFLNSLGNNNQIVNNSVGTTPPIVQTNSSDLPERYAGGSLSIKVLKTDSQAQLAWRGLYKHAHEAGLDKARAREFADSWTTKNTTYNHRADGKSIPFTADEFEALKAKGTASFELTKEFDADILADLNRRVDAITVNDDTVLKVDTNVKLTAQERAERDQKLMQAGQNKAAIQEKPVMALIDGKTSDGKPIDAETALTRYVQQTYNPKTESGSRRVWGDKINEMVSQAKTDGVAIDLKFNEDGTAAVGVNPADKQKLDNLFNQTLNETIKGEQASLKGQQEATNQVTDIGRMYGNGAINTVNHITEPVRGTLETLGVDTSAAKLPKLEYQSEYGKKNGIAGEIGTEIGVGIVSAPALLKTAAGKVLFGVDGAYNVAAGAAGVDPTEKDMNGNPREMGTLERGMRIVGGAGEILGARPNFETAGKSGTTLAQAEETVEALADTGTGIKVSIKTEVPKQNVGETLGGKGSNVLEARLPKSEIEKNAVLSNTIEQTSKTPYTKGVTKVEGETSKQIKYSSKEMLPEYAGEETGSVWGTKVKYLNEAERANLELFVKDGKIVDHSGKLYDTSSSSSVFGAGKGKSIFVMDEKGHIYASNQQSVGKFHHSSILGGKPVSAAGEITVQEGKIIEISNRSGHYQPTQEINSQIIKELKSRGVDVSNVKITGF